MFQSSYIEISKSAYMKNLLFIKEQLGHDVIFSSVVKGNAYGHGIEEFVPLAVECGVKHFSVFSAFEALRIRNVIDKKIPVMIMGYIDNSEIEWAIKNDVEFYVFDRDRFNHTLKIAKKISKPAKIHIEVETGLNRTGFNKKNLSLVIDTLKENNSDVILQGLCTHYAGAESVANYLRIQKQIATFNRINLWLNENGIKPKYLHTACSAAAISYPETRMDMVRIGILQYGYWPTKETFINYLGGKKKKIDPLKRIISWKSRVMSTKEIKTGEFIGYGTTYLATRPMKIAIVPVGYGHGFSRSLSNQGRVLIHGERLSVIGIVNMSLIAVDITNVPGIKKGDEVVIIGKQGELEITVASFAELSNQLNYELLTRLSRNIPRHVVE